MRAYQQARDYAKDRVQGRPVGEKSGDRVPIIQHPDVRRMLMTMRAQIEAMRAFGYVLAADMDLAHKHPDPDQRRHNQAQVDLLIPGFKGWCSEVAVELCSLGVQVHGGMGLVEETGACQHLRDSRIAPIYEGTTGIQAGDLVGRKLAMDKGEAMVQLTRDMRAIERQLAEAAGDELAAIRSSLADGIQALEDANAWMLDTLEQSPESALAASVNYLMLSGYVCGGWQMARAALVAKTKIDEGTDLGFHGTKLATTRFYADQVLPKASALLKAVQSGPSTALAAAFSITLKTTRSRWVS